MKASFPKQHLQIWFAIALVAVLCFWLEATQPALAESTSLSNISQNVFNCMKKHTRGIGGWIVYAGENSGRISVYATILGQVGEVSYSLDTAQATLNLTYVRGQATLSQVSNGLSDTAKKCKSGEYN
jgi:hypothetical protein